VSYMFLYFYDQLFSYDILVGKPKGKMPLGRPRPRLEGNIKMDLIEIGCKNVYWIYLAQDSVQLLDFVNTIMKILVP